MGFGIRWIVFIVDNNITFQCILIYRETNQLGTKPVVPLPSSAQLISLLVIE